MSKIFFSYAWSENNQLEENRETIINNLYNSLKNDGYELVRDKVDLGYKGFISEFMQQIGQADKIIVAISDKYVRSPYCMFELYEIARNCRFEKAVFRERVFPVFVEFIDFTKQDILDKYLNFWTNEQDKWKTFFQVHINDISPEQFARYTKTKLIGQNISQLMDWLMDMNTLNPKILSENDFAGIKKALGSSITGQPQLIDKPLAKMIDTTLNEMDKQRFASLSQRLSQLEDLKKNYEEKRDFSDDPKEKMRCEREIRDLSLSIGQVTADIKNITYS